MSAGGERGPGGREVRHYTPPASLGGRLWSWRHLILRRVVQGGTLLLFFATFHWGWSIAGAPVLRGNLSGSEFAGLVPLADPFAALQLLMAGGVPEATVLLGALLVLAVYAFLGGRTFCSWVCPINPVTDLAGWLRARLGIRQGLRLTRRTRYAVLALTLVLSATLGVAAFEMVSPIGMLHREVVFGLGLGGAAVAVVFLFDLLVLRHGWCGHLCPLGAFYAQVGRVAQVRVRYDEASCTHCGDCARVCPEPQVLDLKRLAARGYVLSGECSNCARCTPVCPEGSLAFHWRWAIPRAEPAATESGSPSPDRRTP